ncbi:MAG: DNA polymerase IV, partial [Allorhizobium sp.]
QKPRGFSVLGEAEAVSVLADKPGTMIWGVGKAFATTLQADGIRTIGQLQIMDESDLMRRYGSMGQRLARLSRGIDERTVHPNDPAKSVSAETTFFDDI